MMEVISLDKKSSPGPDYFLKLESDVLSKIKKDLNDLDQLDPLVFTDRETLFLKMGAPKDEIISGDFMISLGPDGFAAEDLFRSIMSLADREDLGAVAVFVPTEEDDILIFFYDSSSQVAAAKQMSISSLLHRDISKAELQAILF